MDMVDPTTGSESTGSESTGSESTGNPLPGSMITTTTLPDGTVTTVVNYGTTGEPSEDPAILPIGQHSGLFAGRDSISDALGRAEEVLAGYLGFNLGKKELCETVSWPRHFRGHPNPCVDVQLSHSKVDAIGRVQDVVVLDVRIVLKDFNNDSFVDGYTGSGFIAGIDLRKDNKDSFYLRHKGADKLGCSYQSFSDSQIEFRRGPGGTYVDVVGPLHEIIKPSLLTASSAAGKVRPPQSLIDPCVYVNCIELVQRRILKSNSGYVNSLSSCGGCNSCNGGESGGQCATCAKISVCLVNGPLGIVRLEAQAGSNLCGLKSATLHYVGGDCCDQWEDIVVRLAVAELGIESFQVPSYFVTRWGSVDADADNPLGDRAGHEYAWRFIQEKRSSSRGVILS